MYYSCHSLTNTLPRGRAGHADDLDEIRKNLHRYLATIILANKVIPALTERLLETDCNTGFDSDCVGQLIQVIVKITSMRAAYLTLTPRSKHHV